MTIDWNLVDSAEYEELCAIEQDVRSIGPTPYFVRETDKGGAKTAVEVELEDADALWDYIDARGRKGTQLQRYTLGPLLAARWNPRAALGADPRPESPA